MTKVYIQTVAEKGEPDGYAPLGPDGEVPSEHVAPQPGRFRGDHDPASSYAAGDVVKVGGIHRTAVSDLDPKAYDADDWEDVTATDPDAQAALADKADLDVDGKVPVAQLPEGFNPTTTRDWFYEGDLALGIGKGEIKILTDGELLQVAALLGTAPDNQDVLLDLLRERAGVTTAVAGARMTIPAGTKESDIEVPSSPTLLEGDKLKIEVVQTGAAAAAAVPDPISDTVQAVSGDTNVYAVAPPVGAQIGDYWLISLRHNASDLNTPVGLQLLENVGSSANRIARFRRLIDGTEPANYSFTSATSFLSTTGGGAQARHILVRGVNLAAPEEAHDVVTSSSAAGDVVVTPAAPLASALSNALILYTLAMPSNQARAALGPAGFTVENGFAGLAGATSAKHLATKEITAPGNYAGESITIRTNNVTTRYFVGRLILKGISGGGAFEPGADAQVSVRYAEAVA